MNDNIEYEKFTQEIYNEILKNLYVKNIDVKHNVKLTGKSGQKHQIDVRRHRRTQRPQTRRRK